MSADCYLSALEVARLVGERALSPVEYVEMLLARIDEHDPRLDTVLQIDREAVLGSARRAEQAVMDGASLGPLHGVPFGLKDIIDAKGLRTTGHSKILADNVAGHDACATAKIQSAGGLMIGKLATHEFALGGPSFDLPWPPARNPWNRDMWPGGSSSGSAAAVAAGFMPLALGTDTGGSVRNPATQCGLVGMMATYGRVSRRGVFPLSFSLDHVGPLTRTVAENAVLLGVISGHDPADPGSAAAPVPDFTSGFGQGIGGVRVGVIRHFFESDMRAHSDVVAGIDAALAVLSDLGAHVEEVRTEPLEAFTDCNRTILLSEGYAVHETWLRSRPEDYGSLARERFLPGAFLRAVGLRPGDPPEARAHCRLRGGDREVRRGGHRIEHGSAGSDRGCGGDASVLLAPGPQPVQRPGQSCG